MEKERKYKILIADDEYWTREKFRHMIQWEKYSLEFMEPAADGEDVLEKMKAEMPDILITDINMPFMNGVDLLTIVREKYPDVITFVISGYDDFDYVKGTFMAGAINYLKKPVTKVELVNAITSAMERIGEREHQKDQMQKAASAISDREFSQMIQQDKLSFIPSVSVNTSAAFTGMSLILIKIHDLKDSIVEFRHDMTAFSYVVKKKLQEITGDPDAILFNYVYRANEFIIITEKSEKELSRIAEKIKISLSRMLNTCLTICVSGHSYQIETIYMAYVEAVGLLMTRKYRRSDEILFSTDETKEKAAVPQHVSAENEKQLKTYLMTGNRAGIQKLIFETIGLARCSEREWTLLEVKQTVRQVANLIMFYTANEKQENGEGVSDAENIADILDKNVERLDVKNLCASIEEVIDYMICGKELAATDSMKDIVHRAAAYVDSHYAEELTLTSLAERYHVESTYFSRMFRQETGKNLILYITDKRIEKAREYIEKTDMNLTEAAFLVGYDDYTYFSRVFKKSTGHSPREYRSWCRKGKK